MNDVYLEISEFIDSFELNETIIESTDRIRHGNVGCLC